MFLNTIKPALGAKKSATRLGRGIGSGMGKTCGRGHKGQRARAGGFHRIGFEGGQTPLQRRLPKFGFNSQKALVTAEVRLSDLKAMTNEVISLQDLKQAGLVGNHIKRVKLINTGELTKAVTIGRDIVVTKGARQAIESLGGKVES